MALNSRLGSLASAIALNGPEMGAKIILKVSAEDRHALRGWIDSCDVKKGADLCAHLGDLDGDSFGLIWIGLNREDKEAALAAMLAVVFMTTWGSR
jgi:hypothetical protein